jgi:hypothetical protein
MFLNSKPLIGNLSKSSCLLLFKSGWVSIRLFPLCRGTLFIHLYWSCWSCWFVMYIYTFRNDLKGLFTITNLLWGAFILPSNNVLLCKQARWQNFQLCSTRVLSSPPNWVGDKNGDFQKKTFQHLHTKFLMRVVPDAHWPDTKIMTEPSWPVSVIEMIFI